MPGCRAQMRREPALSYGLARKGSPFGPFRPLPTTAAGPAAGDSRKLIARPPGQIENYCAPPFHAPGDRLLPMQLGFGARGLRALIKEPPALVFSGVMARQERPMRATRRYYISMEINTLIRTVGPRG